MAESVADETRWMDVDEGTFVLFAQFAYTGDYSISWGSIPPPVEEAGSLSSASEIKNEWGFGTSSPLKKGKKSNNGPFISHGSVPEPLTPASKIFNSLQYPLVESQSKLCTCKPSINDYHIENSGEVLLAHASLYVLAEKWGGNSLKMLVLSKLHQTLSTLCLDASKIQEVTDLARYTYSTGSTPDLETEIDGLRKLICVYIAANVEVVSEHTSFMDLIEDGGLFVRDLWKLVVPKRTW